MTGTDVSILSIMILAAIVAIWIGSIKNEKR